MIGSAGGIVAHAATIRCSLSLGPGILPIGRLGTVAVAASERRHGLGSRLVKGCLEALEDCGAVLLNPADDAYVHRFYETLGFVPARRSVSIADLLQAHRAARPPELVRPATPDDVQELARLYAVVSGNVPGTLGRESEWWQRRCLGRPLLWAPPSLRVDVLERAGGCAAYSMAWDQDGRHIVEIAGEAEALPALLAAAGGNAPAKVYAGPSEPGWAATASCLGGRTTTETVVMVRAGRLGELRPALTELLAGRGAELSGDDREAEVSCSAGRLIADWSRLLALCYDGAPLGAWGEAGLVRLEGDPSPALPPREASRRPADGF